MIEIHELNQLPDLAEAVRLQKEIWGFQDVDLLPLRLFVVATKVGGQVLGAFDGKRMIGFCLAIPGVKAGGRPYLHSHMMGVDASYRNAGIGRMLKLRQREDALNRGIELIEWTFDPLEVKNAFFNIERLGANVRRYVLNQYGITTSDLNAGMPTDRCVAEWHIAKPHAAAIIAGEPLPRPEIEERIPVPNEIASLRRTDNQRARTIQAEISRRFLECFQRDLAVVGFERNESEGVYLLSKWPYD
jgi:predicted GNAT superfamily acetyltransferase